MVQEMGVLAPVSLSTEALNLLAAMRNTQPPAAMEAPAATATREGEGDVATSIAAGQLPRETGADIGMASPVPLTDEAVAVIAKLRNMKDEGEDWSRWRDVIFRAKASTAVPLPSMPDPPVEFTPAVHVLPDGRETLYCPECYLPLLPDPIPSQLYIFLHAFRYSNAEWSYETDMPHWAEPGFRWE